MKNLQDLVPTPELCKLIPAGKFEDSALEFRDYGNGFSYVYVRGEFHEFSNGNDFDSIPAPTLEEIIAELPELLIAQKRKLDPTLWNVTTGNKDGGWNTIAAISALRLWLQMKGIQV